MSDTLKGLQPQCMPMDVDEPMDKVTGDCLFLRPRMITDHLYTQVNILAMDIRSSDVYADTISGVQLGSRVETSFGGTTDTNADIWTAPIYSDTLPSIRIPLRRPTDDQSMSEKILEPANDHRSSNDAPSDTGKAAKKNKGRIWAEGLVSAHVRGKRLNTLDDHLNRGWFQSLFYIHWLTSQWSHFSAQ